MKIDWLFVYFAQNYSKKSFTVRYVKNKNGVKSMTYMHDKRDSLQGCPSDQLGENGHKNMIKYNFVDFTSKIMK